MRLISPPVEVIEVFSDPTIFHSLSIQTSERSIAIPLTHPTAKIGLTFLRHQVPRLMRGRLLVTLSSQSNSKVFQNPISARRRPKLEMLKAVLNFGDFRPWTGVKVQFCFFIGNARERGFRRSVRPAHHESTDILWKG
jgi:hypothetical protein